jgi:hypothetical protein
MRMNGDGCWWMERPDGRWWTEGAEQMLVDGRGWTGVCGRKGLNRQIWMDRWTLTDVKRKLTDVG